MVNSVTYADCNFMYFYRFMGALLYGLGIMGIVAATCAYDSGPISVGPFFVAIVAALWRVLISVRIAFMSWAYCSWVPWVQINSVNVVKAAQGVVIAVVRKESIVKHSLFALRDCFYSTCWVCSTAYMVCRMHF